MAFPLQFDIQRTSASKFSFCNDGKIKTRLVIEDAEPVKIAAKILSEEEFRKKQTSPLSLFTSSLPISLIKEEKLHLLALNINSATKRLGISRDELFDAVRENQLESLIKEKSGLNFRDSLKMVAPHLSSDKISSIQEFIIKNRRKLLKKAKTHLQRYVYIRADEKVPRGIQFNKNGEVLVHLNKKKLGDPELGRGGSKKVRLAINYDTGKLLAVGRIYDRNGNTDPYKQMKKEMHFCHLLKKSRCIAKIDCLIPILGKKHKFFLIQPYYNYGSLSKTHSNLSERERLLVILDILEGLCDMEEKGIIHRDLKPANILLHRHENGNIQAFIADFGTAAELDDRDAILISCGTNGYLPPECIAIKNYLNTQLDISLLHKAHSHKRDMWTFGSILHRLVTGKRVKAHTRFLKPLQSKESNPLEHLIFELLQNDPERRPLASEAYNIYAPLIRNLLTSHVS